MPAVKPVVSAVTSFFTEGGNGVPPTYPGPDWFNIIQSELLAVLAAAGITPDKASNVQLLAAMRALFLDTSQNGADIQDKALFLQNLGLGEGSALPVGVPVPWPTSTAPTGWLKCNGAPFTAADYPKLALAYPGLVLPDLRGEFIRGWDDGRGVDSGRLIGSNQDFTIQSHLHGVTYVSSATDDGGGVLSSGAGTAGGTITFNTNATGDTETRPRNVAFNYIVRAV
ncbi:phage tail protein [Enterobacter kobei]|uniref:phage tail protein n=1 Tax=Enterobacter kobei TaxID=208224 RepID=UPI0035E43DEC